MPGQTEPNAYENAHRVAREQRILEHMPLVRRIAHWFAASVPRRVDAADLVSAGVVGLIRAVDRYESERGVSFDIFAARYIRGAVLDHLREQDPLPYSTRVKVRRLDAAYLGLERTLQREPRLAEVAVAAGCSEEEADELLARASASTLYSLEELVDRGNEPEVATAAPDALSRIEQGELLQIAMRQLADLQPTERLVLTLYYYEGLKMKDIGTVLDVSESRVSQIHARAMASLRARLREILEQE